MLAVGWEGYRPPHIGPHRLHSSEAHIICERPTYLCQEEGVPDRAQGVCVRGEEAITSLTHPNPPER